MTNTMAALKKPVNKPLTYINFGPPINLEEFCVKRDIRMSDLATPDHKRLAKLALSCSKQLRSDWLSRKSVTERRDENLTDFMLPLKPKWCSPWEMDVATPHEKRQLSAIAHAEVTTPDRFHDIFVQKVVLTPYS